MSRDNADTMNRSVFEKVVQSNSRFNVSGSDAVRLRPEVEHFLLWHIWNEYRNSEIGKQLFSTNPNFNHIKINKLFEL